MRRGELWVASGQAYAGKPRPVVIVQDDSITRFESTVVCLVTSQNLADAPNRVALEPTAANGLERRSWVMTDKVYSFRASRLDKRIGRLTDGEMAEVSEGLKAILGL